VLRGADKRAAPWYASFMNPISIIDSHTGGEPTRLIIDGGPELGTGPLAERLARFRDNADHVRRAVVCEPRGSDVMVGALLCEPHAPDCVAGIIFFNNVGYLGMCGHGMMGVVASLAYLGRIAPGRHRIDTPVGVVEAELHADGSVSIDNVASYRSQRAVSVNVEGHGSVTGDVAWGGNWFFLVGGHGLDLLADNVDALTGYCVAVREGLEAAGVTGEGGAQIDHIELYAPSRSGADCQNFVLCPGKAYDRSPCGTGTSAKLACLAADGELDEGELWRQESVIGSVFEASYRRDADAIRPRIRGTAWVNAQATLIFNDADPFVWGIDKVQD
jgi:4-hydroxyproline epimerase